MPALLNRLSCAVLLALLLSATSGRAEDGRTLALTCRTCHAVSSGQIPSLREHSASRLAERLLDFKYDRIKVTLMNRLSKGYSDAELKAIADYLAGSASHAGP